MHPELAAYEQSIADRLTRIGAVLDGMDAAALNWRPATAGANSAWVLAVHTLGNARAWVLGIACSKATLRDRPGEFASSGGDAAGFRADVDTFVREMHAAFEGLRASELDRRLVPAQELWGEGPPREISIRDALVQVVEHASLHLGHLELTRDLAKRGP